MTSLSQFADRQNEPKRETKDARTYLNYYGDAFEIKPEVSVTYINKKELL